MKTSLPLLGDRFVSLSVATGGAARTPSATFPRPPQRVITTWEAQSTQTKTEGLGGVATGSGACTPRGCG